MANFEYPQYSPDIDSRGSKTYWIHGLADGNGNFSSRNYGGEYLVATRPLRAKRPDVSASVGGVTATWAPHADLLEILEYETEFAGTNFTRTVRTIATAASMNDMPAGTYTARVRARNQLGWGEWTTPSAPVAYTLAPFTSSTPVVSGTLKVGQTLTAAPGAWTPGTTLAYRWLAGGGTVPGASGSTLVLGPGQVGKEIAVRVTGSKPGYITTSKTSAATAAVAKGMLVGGTPTITGPPGSDPH